MNTKLTRLFHLVTDYIFAQYILVNLIVDPILINNAQWFAEETNLTVYIIRYRLITVWFIYYLISEYFTGRTIAKVITGTKVVDVFGGKAVFHQILFRTLLRFIPFIDAITFWFGNGLHDTASSTKLISKPIFGKPEFKLNIVFPTKKIGIGILIFLGILILTNPSIKAFKEYLGYNENEGISRKYNFMVCSIYKIGYTEYLGIGENFFKIDN